MPAVPQGQPAAVAARRPSPPAARGAVGVDGCCGRLRRPAGNWLRIPPGKPTARGVTGGTGSGRNAGVSPVSLARRIDLGGLGLALAGRGLVPSGLLPSPLAVSLLGLSSLPARPWKAHPLAARRSWQRRFWAASSPPGLPRLAQPLLGADLRPSGRARSPPELEPDHRRRVSRRRAPPRPRQALGVAAVTPGLALRRKSIGLRLVGLLRLGVGLGGLLRGRRGRSL